MAIPVVVPTMPQRDAALKETLAQLHGHPWASVALSSHEDSRQDVSNAVRVGAKLCDYFNVDWWLYVEDDVDLGPRFGEIPSVLRWVNRGFGQVCFFQWKDKWPHHDGLVDMPGKVYWSQCTAMRVCDPDEFERFARQWYADHPEHHHASDLLLCAWTRSRRLRVAVHTPSLVQHRQLPSTLGHRSRHRQSESYRRVFGGN